jgi:potassium efflux system protein
LTGVIFLVGVLLLLWQIWQDVLPATKMLDNWELWKVAVGDQGETASVSLRDLFFSLGLFLLTFFGVRNIPGTLELLLLNKLPLDSGSRYAITSIVRYIITVVGVILALNFLKIPWSNYSWLVAAISVGLGFGLQEIVANFVSGLIILLERPVRVGDVVTIDNTTGFVSRIQMRATTVTNFDNQELVVPNKDLVTGKIMNWTLSSVVNRVSLVVGVAYGTDVAKVQRIIEEVAAANPDVLNDPLPVVCFEEFGDSSLNFRLRCCITAMEKKIAIVHALNTGINEAFNREQVVVPFPQRDVHMIPPPTTS